MTGLAELMVNFVTSSYKPEMLKPLVEKISAIPEVVGVNYANFVNVDSLYFVYMVRFAFDLLRSPNFYPWFDSCIG